MLNGICEIALLCTESGCSGSISPNRFVFLQVGGCAISNMAHPCDICGRLYRWANKEPVVIKGKKLFWEGDLKTGKVVARD